MALSTLLDSFLPQSEKVGLERVKTFLGHGISLFGKGASMELATDIHHMSGKNEKVFKVRSQRSRSLLSRYW